MHCEIENFQCHALEMESGNLLSDSWITVAVGLGSLLFVSLSFVYWWTMGSGPGGVPKGSLGWPFIGETLRFFSGSPLDFVQERVKRYGMVFKTHFMGTPTIFVTDPDMSAYVLADRRNQFNGTSPLLGNLGRLLNFNISRLQGEEHNLVHRAMLSSLSADVLNPSIGRIEDLASSFLESYVEEAKPVVMVKESKKFALYVVVDLLLHPSKDGPVYKMLEELFEVYTTGFVALPINLPGTNLNKALKAKDKIADIILNLADKEIKKKETDAENSKEIFHMLKNLENSPEFTKFGSPNPRKRLSHLLADICFAGYESTGTALTWTIQNLYENPEVLQAMTVEHDKIRQKKANGERLTRGDIQSMTHTSRVIQETLRRNNVVPGILRQAAEDVEFNGYKIPKGWNMQISLSHMHMNPEYFGDVLSFDPSRFQKTPRRNSYLPFGLGGRWCVGAEVAKLELTVFLYYFTSYRWARVGNHSGITSLPFPVPNDNLPIQFYGKKSL